MKVSYIDNAGYFLRYLTNTILKFNAVIIGAAVERSSKLSNKRYASYIQKTQLVSWYDLLGEVVELLVTVPLWGVIARAEGSRQPTR